MRRRRRYIVGLIASMTLIITYLHYSTNTVIHSQHDLYRELYYLPILLGALAFGLEGGLAVYLTVLALYLPYLLRNWTDDPSMEANRILHLFLQGCIAIIAGILIDRERRRRTELEKERYLAGIGRAATAIVHDVKSPLIAIRGFAHRLKEHRGSVDTAADAIIDSAEQIGKIADDALDFAKPIELDLREEDLVMIVHDACTICRTIADAAGVDLSLDLPPHPVKGPIDGPRMKRAIINLINNAIEASAKGRSVSVRVSANGARPVITICDFGSGMNAETLENVFVPFFTKKTGGSGIGMSVAKKIIDGHNGIVRIRSRPGFGTEVSVELAAIPGIQTIPDREDHHA